MTLQTHSYTATEPGSIDPISLLVAISFSTVRYKSILRVSNDNARAHTLVRAAMVYLF